jgi:hypothetical protein
MLIMTIAETLASILNRTTSLLPNALFASLGMPRGDENLGDAKHVCLHTLPYAILTYFILGY